MIRAPESEPSEQLAVTARGLRFSYSQRQALDGVGFDVPVGEIYGFLGPNGGGKTTLFRILATLLRPDEGSLTVFGSDIVEEAEFVRLQLGVVFQSPSVDEHLTVGENLVHQGHLYGLRGAELASRITGVLESLSIEDRRNDPVKTLSGGLRRRVEIAKALLHRPRLLLMDEPSTGLDPGARREVWAVLEELRSSHEVTVLLTTHFMDEADRCDRLALVDRGRLVAEGSPESLKGEIGGEVVLIATDHPATLCREIRDGFDLEASVQGDRVRLEDERAHSFIAQLVESFPDRIDALSLSKPTLEDVFLHRTGRGLWEEE
jgi:ABC-2 type transport system ATP-binding protein